MVFNLALRMVRDRELAEDLTQEVFVKVYQGLPGFGGRSSLSTWIYRIAFNTVMSEMEKARYRYETNNTEVLGSRGRNNETPGDTPGDLLHAIEQSDLIRRRSEEHTSELPVTL